MKVERNKLKDMFTEKFHHSRNILSNVCRKYQIGLVYIGF